MQMELACIYDPYYFWSTNQKSCKISFSGPKNCLNPAKSFCKLYLLATGLSMQEEIEINKIKTNISLICNRIRAYISNKMFSSLVSFLQYLFLIFYI